MKTSVIFFRSHLMLLIILFCAAFLRLYNLAVVPPSASLDELSIGWNAYSILRTGRDEYGTWLPLILRAYDDFRPALYVYLVVPFVAVLGLTTQAVRVPSVLLSVLSVAAVYVLANELLKEYVKNMTIRSITITPGHIAAVLLAVSPWHLYISRLGHEVNAGLSFLIFGAMFFFLALSRDKNRLLLPLSALCLAISFGSYQSEKVVLPLLFGVLGVLFYRVLKRNRGSIIALLIGIIFSIPTISVTFSGQGMTRFAGTSAFTQSNPLYETEKRLYVEAASQGDIVKRIVHHPRLTSFKIFTSNYILHFQPSWLFSGGPFDQHKVPHTGLLFWWELPLILLGLFIILKKRIRYGWVVVAWLVIAPLPAAITTQTPHAMRSFTFLPSWQLLGSLGVMAILLELQTVKRVIFLLLLIIALLISTMQMYQRYLTTFPKTQSDSFGYALHDALKFVRNNNPGNTPVILTPVVNLQTYMFYLFEMKYDPVLYQQYGGTLNGGAGTEFSFGNVAIKNFRGTQLEKGKTYIGTRQDFPPDATITYEAKYLDGTPGVYVSAQ